VSAGSRRADAPTLAAPRAAFTLIELLVVMAIIALLAALVIAFFPSISSQTDEAGGAVSLQGWLNIARQKAIRNQQPFGLRLWIKDPNTMYATECQYIEQPDDFTGGTVATVNSRGNPGPWDTLVIAGADPTGGFADPTLFAVLPGDYIELLGSGLMHRIVAVNTAPPSFSLATAIPYQISTGTPTSSYRILRQPRVVGEERMPLPSTVVVDLSTNIKYSQAPYGLPVQVPLVPVYAVGLPPPNPPTGYYVDVLFSPSGSVITPSLAANYMAFWVRLPDINNPTNEFAGTPTIIAVWAQTGLAAAYPPVPGNNPYVDIR
jgi:prepilin-type N-terminal cleavage/methylation domain-containing protein